MAMTETRPAPQAAAAAATAGAPADRAGLAGWLSTSDHKRIGRLYIATALLFLLVGGVVGELLAVERVGNGFDVLDAGSFAQVYTFHGEVALSISEVDFHARGILRQPEGQWKRFEREGMRQWFFRDHSRLADQLI